MDIHAGNSRGEVGFGGCLGFVPVGTTDLRRSHRGRMSEDLYSVGVSSPRAISSSPSLHGGRGASPSEGGRPSDLSALAGGGGHSDFHLCAVPLGDAPGRVFSSFASKEGEDEISSEYVDHQEGRDYGFHAAAAGSSPRVRARLPGELLHSWLVIYTLFTVAVTFLGWGGRAHGPHGRSWSVMVGGSGEM